MRAEWSGAMRRGHRAWIHPLARCGSAAAIAIVRSNTGFGECRRRQTGERQGGAYRADHPSPFPKLRLNLPTFPRPLSSGESVRMTKAARHTAQQSSERSRTHASELAQDHGSIDWEIALPETRQVGASSSSCLRNPQISEGSRRSRFSLPLGPEIRRPYGAG